MAEKRKQVLFVDDEESFLELVRDVMTHYAATEWEVHTALDVGRALGFLQDRHIDLLVIDVHMPVVDGVQFLTLLRRTYPNLLRVVLTGDASETYRAACLNAGAELFLNKPTSTEGWQSIYTTLNELMQLRPAEGFRGVLRTVGLQDILQMECLGRNSSVLDVVTPDLHGRIFIQTGQIIHAEAGARQAEEALNLLLTLPGGEFNVLPFAEPAVRSISDSWEFLLMEAARKRDEAAEAAGGTPAPPPAAAAASEKPDRGGSPVPAPAPALSAEDVTLRPRIDEVLVASPQGDVLYEWQCKQATERIRFLEFVSQRARQIGQGLLLGSFDRLEMEGGQVRAVVQVQSDRTVLVTRSMVESGSAPQSAG